MQAVILAAGRGKRMGELTETLPKPLLQVGGKTLLEHKFDALPEDVDEIVLVIGYLGHLIREKFGDAYKERTITYVEQENPVGGTMDALSKTKDVVSGKFIATNADDIHLRNDMQSCLLHEWAFAVMNVPELGSSARVRIDANGNVADTVEADMHGGGPGLAGVGFYVLDARIFDVPPVQLPGRTEFGLPQTMVAASQQFNISLVAVPVSFCLHITSPEDLPAAAAILAERKE